MTPSEQLIDALGRLRAVLDNPTALAEAISEFQRVVWASKEWEHGLAPDSVAVLRTLAYDLDFYEPDATARQEDPSFFGNERALEEIRTALAHVA